MAERSSFGTASLFLGWSLGLFALISGIQEVSAWNSGILRPTKPMDMLR